MYKRQNANGHNTVAIGNESDVTDNWSTAIGGHADCTGHSSVAVGYSCDVHGNAGVTVGSDSEAAGGGVSIGASEAILVKLSTGDFGDEVRRAHEHLSVII